MTNLTKEFIAKLVEVQAGLVAGKDKKNDFGNYAYRTAEGILASVKPLLNSRGLFLFITDEIVQVGGENISKSTNTSKTPNKEGMVAEKETITEVIDSRFYLKATVTITDGESSHSTSAMARESLDKKGMDSSQITGAASSYARKYALSAMFGIDDAKQDPDAGANNPALLKAKAIIAEAETKEAAIEVLKPIVQANTAIKAAVMKELTKKFK